MESDKAIFEKLIREDRAARESHDWRGTFLEYLDLVREDPTHPEARARPPLRHDHGAGRARHPRDRRPRG